MGNIEIRHLKLIKAIEDVGSLKEAAKLLFLTPSALSHQLKELENRLNTQLFYRKNNRLIFTPSGKELKEASKDIINRLDQVDVAIKELITDNSKKYIHGYSTEESLRLVNQAESISDVLHYDSIWEEGSLVLEAGCGVGAQTKSIAALNPSCKFIAIDIALSSLKSAQEMCNQHHLKNIVFKQADIFSLPFKEGHFDHIFVCFLLEHLSKPKDALKELHRVLKPGGTITVIEGDHGSTFFHPDSMEARKTIDAQVRLQHKKGGNANIGRQLYPLLSSCNFSGITISPRQVYVDDSKPELLESFIKNTFTAMIKGISEESIAQGIIDKRSFEKGIRDLYRTAEGGGTFSYTFFKAKGIKVAKEMPIKALS